MTHRLSSLQKNEFFTFTMNAIAVMILLIGNSSYTYTTTGQSMDSSRPNMALNESTNDNIKSITISIPTKKMIRQADNEINRSMKDLIDMINTLHVAGFYTGYGDNTITKQFFDSFIIPINTSTHISDEDIELKFKAENILFESNKAIIKADNEINQVFNSGFRLDSIDDCILNTADNTMNKNFHDEFQ